MRRATEALLAIIIAVGTAAYWATPAKAAMSNPSCGSRCTCVLVDPRDAAAAFRRDPSVAHYWVRGEVMRVSLSDSVHRNGQWYRPIGGAHRITTVRVIERWGNAPADSVLNVYASTVTMCPSAVWAPGSSYLFRLQIVRDTLVEVGFCGRALPVDSISTQSALAVLRAP